MKIKNKNKGMTLLEIIIAMAILAIIVVALLSLFGFGYSSIFVSGQRTENAMGIKAVMDDLNSQTFYNKDQIITFSNSEGYNTITDINLLATRVTGIDTNVFVGNEETKSDVPGFQVTVLKFYQNGKFSVRATTFVIKGGS